MSLVSDLINLDPVIFSYSSNQCHLSLSTYHHIDADTMVGGVVVETCCAQNGNLEPSNMNLSIESPPILLESS